MSPHTAPALILASRSPYRRELLTRLSLAFDCASPDIDESPLPQETVAALVGRLSLAKAQALAARYPQHLIIGSDQAASLNGRIMGKPLSHARAMAQLEAASGQTVRFYTGLCLLNTFTGQAQQAVETVDVNFRPLSSAEIERYLRREQPYDCAGSFKCEGLGVSLFESLEGRDPNSLIGLPLIRLCAMLRAEGLQLP